MTFGTLIQRSLRRNPTRLLLTLAAAAVGVLTWVTLRTIVVSWNDAQTIARADRVVTRNKVTFVIPLERRMLDQIRAAHRPDGQPLVKVATFGSWFGGVDPIHEHDFFATFAIDGETYFDVFDEIDLAPDQRKAFLADRSAAVVGDRLAARMGWKVGDRITLRSKVFPAPDDQPWAFNIAGIYTLRGRSASMDRQTFLLRSERLDDQKGPMGGRNHVGMVTSKLPPDERAADAAAAIDAMFADTDNATLTEDERAAATQWMGMVSTILRVLGLLAVGILAILGLVLANAMAMSVRERTSEYAALLALGFRPRHIVGLVVGESTLLAALGAVIGLAAAEVLVGHRLAATFMDRLSTMFPVFHLTIATMAIGGGAVVVLGALAGLVPAARLSRLRVTDALRRLT